MLIICMQAELVAQFLCCIPLTTVDVVLSWLKPAVPAHEQEALLAQVCWQSTQQQYFQLQHAHMMCMHDAL